MAENIVMLRHCYGIATAMPVIVIVIVIAKPKKVKSKSAYIERSNSYYGVGYFAPSQNQPRHGIFAIRA